MSRAPYDGPRLGIVWTWSFVLATLVGWTMVAVMHFGMMAIGRPLPLSVPVIAHLPDWYLWAAASPLVFWMAWRVPISRGRWLGPGLTHFAAGTVVTAAILAVETAFNRAIGTPAFAGPLWDIYPRVVLRNLPSFTMTYWVIAAAAHAIRYYQSTRYNELQAAELGRQLSQAQLATLRGQLQPHFFFNTLHTIAGLVRDGRGEAATRTIAKLGDLFRQTLGRLEANEIPLQDELQLVQAYLDIEQLRFADRLTVRLDIAPETLTALVPSLGLQPIVENAVRHGIARDPAARLLEITTRRANGSLRIDVRNDGPAFTPPPEASRGVGLSNTRARFDRLYGSAFHLEIGPAAPSGVCVHLEIPWRTAERG